jgi:hypothetical protein
MSDLTSQQISALGTSVMPAVLPPDVRAAGPKGVQLYQAALGFEQLLTQELTSQVASTMQGSDGSDGSGATGDGSSSDDPSSASIFPSMDASTSMYGQMLPQALSDGITQAGGLGVAHALYLLMAQQTGLVTPSSSSGAGTGGASGTAASTATGTGAGA